MTILENKTQLTVIRCTFNPLKARYTMSLLGNFSLITSKKLVPGSGVKTKLAFKERGVGWGALQQVFFFFLEFFSNGNNGRTETEN